MKLNVKVVPGSSRDTIAGWLGDALKIKVKAPPEAGRANAAVLKLLATTLDVTSDRIKISSGHGTPRKVIEIDGLTEAELHSIVKS